MYVHYIIFMYIIHVHVVTIHCTFEYMHLCVYLYLIDLLLHIGWLLACIRKSLFG